jgi:hypothetical protein
VGGCLTSDFLHGGWYGCSLESPNNYLTISAKENPPEHTDQKHDIFSYNLERSSCVSAVIVAIIIKL